MTEGSRRRCRAAETSQCVGYEPKIRVKSFLAMEGCEKSSGSQRTMRSAASNGAGALALEDRGRPMEKQLMESRMDLAPAKQRALSVNPFWSKRAASERH